MSSYRVGFARVDITPTESVPLAGLGRSSQRMSRCVRDELYASCFAISDEQDNTVILMTTDNQEGPVRHADMVRAAVAPYGIPADHVVVCGTHTHAAPDPWNFEEPSMTRYREMLEVKLAQCAVSALEDRKPAKIYLGETETKGMNFVRQYRNTTPDGEHHYFSVHCGVEVMDETTCHATEADPTLHAVKVVREDCPDLILVNFRAHGTMILGIDLFVVSADYVGGLRSAFEKDTDAILTYFNGAAGNISPTSKIPGETITTDINAYGRLLSDFVHQALEHMTELEYHPIETRRHILAAPVNHPSEEEAAICREAVAFWEATGDYEGSKKVGAAINLHSPYQAIEVLGRSTMDATVDMELNAIALGELAIVTAPGEMFDSITVRTEDNAPFRKVLAFGYANGMKGYLPDRRAFETGTYEVDCCKFVPGIGEMIGDKFLEMLSDIRRSF